MEDLPHLPLNICNPTFPVFSLQIGVVYWSQNMKKRSYLITKLNMYEY